MTLLVMGGKKAASIAARSLVPGKPHHAQWFITRKCNYKCLNCNIWEEQDKEELSTEDIKRGMDVLKDAGIVELVLSGGNPLLRDDIGEIIDYATKHFVTTVYDNGSLAVKKLDLLRKVDFAAISIDSLNAEKHDFIKNVPGAWQNAMHAVEVLKKEGVKVCVAPTISQINLYEIEELTNHFTSKDIPILYGLYSYDTEGSNQLFRIGKHRDEFIITDKQAMVNLCDTLQMARKTSGKRILITDKLLKTLRSLFAEEKRVWSCKALQNFLVIDHLGRIAGCHNQTFTSSIFDLPKNRKTQEYNTQKEQYKICTKCNYLCYIFYSIYGTPTGHLTLVKEQWKNAALLLKKQ
ncbi:MAG: radical SAM protein [Nitrososphaerota archaeon]|jgi:MoaA/NifB/PqqE/SkfB family radical SAM enzyme|nr:radical SAM protein [Nitrososphaerota archaeon]